MILLVLLTLAVCAQQTVGESAGCTTIGSAVYCEQLSGKFLPRDNDGEIDSIFITNSDMTDLTSDAFSSYRNLDKILITNSLFGTDPDILKDLKNLRSLKITNCSLDDGVGTLFLHNAKLEKLSLRGNKITKVTISLVFHLQHLLVLDLSENEIFFVEDGAFDHMNYLQEVNLEGNALQEVAPEVVARAGDRCTICRTAGEESDKERADGTEVEQRIVQRPCTPREATRCAADRWLDRLWWRAPVLTLRLRGNPLCNASAQTQESLEALVVESREEDGDLMCEMEANKCLLHDRRRLFLLEACGVEEDGNKQQVPQPVHDEITTAGGIIFLYGTISGIIISGLVIGVIVGMFVKKKKAYSTVPMVEFPQANTNKLVLGDTSTCEGFQHLQSATIPLDEEDHDSGPLQDEYHDVHPSRVSTETNRKVKQMIEAMRKGDHPILERELKKNTSLCLSPDENGDTLLHHAARGGEVKFIDELLNAGFSANEQNKMGQSPLHVALLDGNQVAAIQMIKKEANLELADFYGHRPLHVAASKGYGHIVRLLLQMNVHVNSKTNEKMTPLYNASQEGHFEIVDLLIKKGAQVNAETSRGYVPLHVAAWNGHTKTVQRLVEEMEDVNVRDIYDWTPLHNASRKGHHEIVKILFEYKADVHANTNGGHTPLHKAAKGGHLQTIKELLAHGADVRSQNNDGKTAADIAQAERHEECLHYLAQLTADPPTSISCH